MNRRTLIAAALAGCAWAMSLSATAQTPLPDLSKADWKLVDQAQAYLQNLKIAKGHFTQTNSRGQSSSGTLYLDRPGKARFEYDPPAQMLVVADGHNVSVYDRRLKSFDRYRLGVTPLGFFLSKRIRLDDQVRVSRVIHEPDGFALNLTDSSGQADGRLVLDFAGEPFALRGWTVIDGQGVQTKVQLSELVAVDSLDPALFVLADPRKAPVPVN